MQEDVPRAKAGKTCRYFMKDVSECCHTCAHWVGVKWELPDKSWDSIWRCADVAAAVGMVDVVRSAAQMSAETQELRKEVAKRAISPPAWAVKEMMREVTDGVREQLAAEIREERQLSLGIPERALLDRPKPLT